MFPTSREAEKTMTIIEKRKHMRVDAVAPPEVNIYNDDVLIKEERGKTLNISKGGALIETAFPLQEGQKIALVISIKTDFVYISSEVIHTRQENASKYQSGVKFLTIDETGQQILKKYIAIFTENLES